MEDFRIEKQFITPYPSHFWQNAAAWGWNSNQRAGNLTEVNINAPRQVQRSNKRNYISSSAGKHHSLLVCDSGNVYSFGDGRKGQLGYGNMFNVENRKLTLEQATPKPITPSGELKFNRDVKCVQVAAGGVFSVAREPNADEESSLIPYYLPMEVSIKRLSFYYPDSGAIMKAACTVRQERCLINRKAEGQILVWGAGNFGELGLGKDTTFMPHPKVIKHLRKQVFRYIAAGEKHVLAIDMNGRLFSWGCGKGGRLGHEDFESRFAPELVKFFSHLIVLTCAAGDAHSAVIATARDESTNTAVSTVYTLTKRNTLGGSGGGVDSSEVLSISRKIFCFGRGAHGRLGNGTNRNQCKPVMIPVWPPSVKSNNVIFVQVACGGAHTIALGYINTPTRLVYPFGCSTVVYGWGYGWNGQLGTGYQYDTFVPVKCRLPKAEIIVEISAGRSWSTARSIGGTLYTWGKGLRGQLGRGKMELLALAPREMPCYAHFMHISSGYAHNVGLTIPRKYFSLAKIEHYANAINGKYKIPLISEEEQEARKAKQSLLNYKKRPRVPLPNIHIKITSGVAIIPKGPPKPKPKKHPLSLLQQQQTEESQVARKMAPFHPFELHNQYYDPEHPVLSNSLITLKRYDSLALQSFICCRIQSFMTSDSRTVRTLGMKLKEVAKAFASYSTKRDYAFQARLQNEYWAAYRKAVNTGVVLRRENYRYVCLDCAPLNIEMDCGSYHSQNMCYDCMILCHANHRVMARTSLTLYEESSELLHHQHMSKHLFTLPTPSMNHLVAMKNINHFSDMLVKTHHLKDQIHDCMIAYDIPPEQEDQIDSELRDQVGGGMWRLYFPRPYKAKSYEREYHPDLYHPKVFILPYDSPKKLERLASMKLIVPDADVSAKRLKRKPKKRKQSVSRSSSPQKPTPSSPLQKQHTTATKSPGAGHAQSQSPSKLRPAQGTTPHARTITPLKKSDHAHPPLVAPAVSRTSSSPLKHGNKADQSSHSPTRQSHSPLRQNKVNKSPHRKKRSASAPSAATIQKQKVKVVVQPVVNLETINNIQAPKMMGCFCGLFNTHCHVLPNISEDVTAMIEPRYGGDPPELNWMNLAKLHTHHTKSAAAPVARFTSKYLHGLAHLFHPTYVKYKAHNDMIEAVDTQVRLHHEARYAYYAKYAIIIQKYLRGYLKRVEYTYKKLSVITIRREVCKNHVANMIMKPIFEKVTREYTRYREKLELKMMRQEEGLMKHFTYYMTLQSTLSGISAIEYGIQQMIGQASIQLPLIKTITQPTSSIPLNPNTRPSTTSTTIDKQKNVKNNENDAIAATITTTITKWYPSFAFSWQSIRAWQLACHPNKRLSPQILSKLARAYPRIRESRIAPECAIFDPDVNLFLRPYLRDQQTVQTIVRTQKRLEDAKLQRQKVAEEALLRLKRLKPNARQPPPPNAPNAVTNGNNGNEGNNNNMNINMSPMMMMMRQQLAMDEEYKKKRRELLHNQWKERVDYFEKVFPSKTIEMIQFEHEYFPFPSHLQLQDYQYLHTSHLALGGSIKLMSSGSSSRNTKSSHRMRGPPPVASGPLGLGTTTRTAVNPSKKAQTQPKEEVVDSSKKIHHRNSNNIPGAKDHREHRQLTGRQRRYTIGGPEQLYRRVVKQVTLQLPQVMWKKRRLSLPTNLALFHPPEIPASANTQNEIKNSLKLFSEKCEEWNFLEQDIQKFQSRLLGIHDKKKRQAVDEFDLMRNRQQQQAKKTAAAEEEDFSKESKVSKESKDEKKDKLAATVEGTTTAATGGGVGTKATNKKDDKPIITIGSLRNQLLIKMKTLMSSSMLNQRLPYEINELLLHPRRRKTIHESERVYSQLITLMEQRTLLDNILHEMKTIIGHHPSNNNASKPQQQQQQQQQAPSLVKEITTRSLYRRRRSFDYQEERDLRLGISPQLDFVFTPEEESQTQELDLVTMKKLKEFSKHIETILDTAKYANNVPDMEHELTDLIANGKSDGAIIAEKSKIMKLKREALQLLQEEERKANKKSKGGILPMVITKSKKNNETQQEIPNTSENEELNKSTTMANGMEIEVWQEHYTPEGVVYYFLPHKEQSCWELPVGEHIQVQVQYQDQNVPGQPWYWLNHTTGETHWLDGTVRE